MSTPRAMAGRPSEDACWAPVKEVAVDAQELRAAQAPLKDRYREQPAAATITLHATGELGSEEVSCSVDTGRALVEAGLHPATGGGGSPAGLGGKLLAAPVGIAGGAPRGGAPHPRLRLA